MSDQSTPHFDANSYLPEGFKGCIREASPMEATHVRLFELALHTMLDAAISSNAMDAFLTALIKTTARTLCGYSDNMKGHETNVALVCTAIENISAAELEKFLAFKASRTAKDKANPSQSSNDNA